MWNPFKWLLDKCGRSKRSLDDEQGKEPFLAQQATKSADSHVDVSNIEKGSTRVHQMRNIYCIESKWAS